MADPRIKTIKIKTGVVNRLAKEKFMYEKEAEEQRERVQKLKDKGEDEHVIRKQEEVLVESLMMVPDCARRLQRACDDLKNILDSEKELAEAEEYIAASTALVNAAPQLQTAATS